MKKLIKISDYYYVIDDKAEIRKNDWLIENNIYVNKVYSCEGTLLRHDVNLNRDKIICSTNPSLPLPQITNASDELVGKEIEVEFIYEIHSYYRASDTKIDKFKSIQKRDDYAYELELMNFTTHYVDTVILKPISKETSTNETLEEVAKQYEDVEISCCNQETKYYLRDTISDAFIAGYKHCEKTMYSADDMLKAFCHGVYKQLMGNDPKYLTFEEWFKEFNNNKK